MTQIKIILFKIKQNTKTIWILYELNERNLRFIFSVAVKIINRYLIRTLSFERKERRTFKCS